MNSSEANYLPKAPPPNTMGVRASAYGLGGGAQTLSIQQGGTFHGNAAIELIGREHCGANPTPCQGTNQDPAKGPPTPPPL